MRQFSRTLFLLIAAFTINQSKAAANDEGKVYFFNTTASSIQFTVDCKYIEVREENGNKREFHRNVETEVVLPPFENIEKTLPSPPVETMITKVIDCEKGHVHWGTEACGITLTRLSIFKDTSYVFATGPILYGKDPSIVITPHKRLNNK